MTCLLLVLCLAFAGPAYTVDRFEGGHAVLEGPGGYVVVTVSQLPAGAREGHVLAAVARLDEGA